MPGREQEYQNMMASGGGQVNTGPVNKPPPIDDERRSRSPGLRNNFYDVPQSDFKRPWGSRGPVPPTDAPPNGTPLPQPPAGYGAPRPPAQGPPQGASQGSQPPPQGQGQGQGGVTDEGPGGRSYGPPPIDDERRARSPGVQHNFWDVHKEDFAQPHGMVRSTNQPQPPQGAPPPQQQRPTPPQQGSPPAAASGGGDERGDNSMEERALELAARLERSNQRLEEALAETAAREEAARKEVEQQRKEVEEARAREDARVAEAQALSQRLQALEEKLRKEEEAKERMGFSSGTAAPTAAAEAKAEEPLPPPIIVPPPQQQQQPPPSGAYRSGGAAANGDSVVGKSSTSLGGGEATRDPEPMKAAPRKRIGSTPRYRKGPSWEHVADDDVAVTSDDIKVGRVGSGDFADSRSTLPAKVEMIRKRLGLGPGSGSLVAAVREASEKVGLPKKGGTPLTTQVDLLMARLFGDGQGGA